MALPAPLLALAAPEDEDAAVLLLRSLRVPDRRKKELLIEWTQLVGVALTRELVEKVLGPYFERG